MTVNSSSSRSISYLSFPLVLRPDSETWPALKWLHDHTQDTTHSVGLLRTSHWPVGETSTWQHNKWHERAIHGPPPGGFRTRNPSCSRPRLSLRGHWDRLFTFIYRWGLREEHCTFLTSALVGNKWAASRPEGKAPLYPSAYPLCKLLVTP